MAKVKNVREDEILKKVFLVTERLVVFDDLDDVFEHVVKTAVLLTRAEAATIRVFDVTTGTLKIVKGFGVSQKFLSQPSIRIGEGITGRTVLTGKPFSTTDVRKVPFCIHKELARLERIKAVMCLPLKVKDRSIGCITTYRKSTESFTPHDILLLSIFSAEVAVAIEKMRLIGDLRKQAMYDPLTDIYNKGALLKKLDSELGLAQRHGYNTSLIFIDIDDFKKFNDSHGHLLGDKLLCDLAGLLKEHCRRTDILGRFGGEEFIIINPHTTKEGALVLAEKIRETVSKHRFVGRDKDVCITVSAGISSFPVDGRGLIELLKKADGAMYQSKKLGKNMVSAWSDERKVKSYK